MCSARAARRGADGEAAPSELKAATSFPRNSIWEIGFFMFVDRVNERGKGKLKLNYVGGPEAIPAFQLFDAVRSGVVDVASGVGSSFSAACRKATR